MDYVPSEDEKDHDVRMNEPEDEQMHQDLLEDVPLDSHDPLPMLHRCQGRITGVMARHGHGLVM